MFKKSLKNTILINVGAFVLVFFLELLSGWTFRGRHDTPLDYYAWGLDFTISIMVVIWINHFVLIPYLLDKKRYFVYVPVLLISILFGACLKTYPEIIWPEVAKMISFLIYTTGAGMAAFFLRRSIIFRRESDEKEKLQKERELKYLKDQVNPHFLFNALNSIYALSRQQSSETPDLVMQLSELMRYQLESSKNETVLLKEELKFIENYLLLEEKRLSDRCSVEFLMAGEVSELRISPMLLIPFVENAIKHGAQSTNEQSTIDISVYIQDTTLNFCVANSKPDKVSSLNRTGLGLENVTRRLKLLYPDAHALEIDDGGEKYEVKLSIDLAVSKLKKTAHA